MKFLILNGPNLNIMRWSEPGVPGELDYNAIMDYVQAGCEQLGIETDCCQSNHEGDLVDEIQAAAQRWNDKWVREVQGAADRFRPVYPSHTEGAKRGE
mgnify:CR=1 FL=1